MTGILREHDSNQQVNNNMHTDNIKKAAHQLIDKLPDNVTWDEVIYEIELRREIEEGLADSNAGRTVSSDEVRKEFGLKK